MDTSAIENAIEQATSDLADLQSDLASQKSIAEADSASLTEERKKKCVSATILLSWMQNLRKNW